jgi:hypothetical protein
MFTTSGKYPWSFVTQTFHNGQPRHGDDRITFEVMTLWRSLSRSEIYKKQIRTKISSESWYCLFFFDLRILITLWYLQPLLIDMETLTHLTGMEMGQRVISSFKKFNLNRRKVFHKNNCNVTFYTGKSDTG